MANVIELEKYLGQKLESIIKSKLFPIIERRCVSKEKSPDEMLKCADLVKEIMQNSGIENLRVLRTGESYPAVYGEVKGSVEGSRTILVGGHYDAQPSDSKMWKKTKPHEPVILQEDGEKRIYGRGASDDLGQVLTHLIAVEYYLKNLGALPVNIKFLIEGGEEVGSKDMDKLLSEHKNLLSTDMVVITDGAAGRMYHPAITTTTRGLVGAYVTLKVGNIPPHSGDNLSIPAVERLAYILTTMKDHETGKILIPGFYDSVKTFSREECELGYRDSIFKNNLNP